MARGEGPVVTPLALHVCVHIRVPGRRGRALQRPPHVGPALWKLYGSCGFDVCHQNPLTAIVLQAQHCFDSLLWSIS